MEGTAKFGPATLTHRLHRCDLLTIESNLKCFERFEQHVQEAISFVESEHASLLNAWPTEVAGIDLTMRFEENVAVASVRITLTSSDGRRIAWATRLAGSLERLGQVNPYKEILHEVAGEVGSLYSEWQRNKKRLQRGSAGA